MRIGVHAAARGYRLAEFDIVGSTNDIAMARGREGDVGRLWVVAAEQTGGRGRLGRTWISPPGNLHASLLLIDPCPVARLPELGFVTGVALAEALETLAGVRARVSLKWPNDALIDGAKLSGVLMESTNILPGRLACIIGIGVNCVAHPGGLPYPATDLAARGLEISRGDMFEALADAMARALDTWAGPSGFAAIRAAWLARAYGLGSSIRVAMGDRIVSGLFRTIDERGRLVLAGQAGDFVVDAGDVLPPPSVSLAGGGQGKN